MPQEKNWIEEFENKFSCGQSGCDCAYGIGCLQNIINFIQSLLSRQRAELVEGIIGEIGAKLLAKHSPQIVLDAYFNVANEILEANAQKNETNN